MNIRIENRYGFSVEAGEKTDLRLMDYPDFGNPLAELKCDKIPGRDGEIFKQAQIGARDIFLKLESGLPLSITSRVLAPGMDVTLYINNKWTIRGHIKGIKEHRRPARLAKPVITVEIRCHNPYFSAINGSRSISFENYGGGIYETGDYTCTKFTVVNEGDVPCPISVTMCSTSNSANGAIGLFNYLDWNNGKPVYNGLVLKSGTEPNVDRFITTDTSSDRFFESYSEHRNCDYFLLPPGKTTLFAQNSKGVLEFSPLYLYIDGRDI